MTDEEILKEAQRINARQKLADQLRDLTSYGSCQLHQRVEGNQITLLLDVGAITVLAAYLLEQFDKANPPHPTCTS